MKATLDCYSCFIRQGLEASRTAGASADKQAEVVRAILRYLLEEVTGNSPVYYVRKIQQIIQDITGVEDPYRTLKAAGNLKAMELTKGLANAPTGATTAQQLEHYIRIAIAGNVIDYGPTASFDLEKCLQRCLVDPLAVNHLELLEKRLQSCRTLAYIADNAGEIAFDRLLLRFLIQQYDIEEVLFVVRAKPFLNDALESDAEVVGITDLPGLNILTINAGVPDEGEPGYEQWESITGADLRIAKGQANAEALEDQDDFFLLFLIKCQLVARIFEARAQTPLPQGGMMLFSTNTTPATIKTN